LFGIFSGGHKPSQYTKLKGNKATVGKAIALSVKHAYSPLYEANETAHELPPEEMKGLIAQVSGAEDSLISFIIGTFKNLVKLADFTEAGIPNEEEEKQNTSDGSGKENGDEEQGKQGRPNEFKPDFRFNIEIHLPSNGTEETYLAIFNALRKSLG
jgi:Family of unknown function (DUF5343)